MYARMAIASAVHTTPIVMESNSSHQSKKNARFERRRIDHRWNAGVVAGCSRLLSRLHTAVLLSCALFG